MMTQSELKARLHYNEETGIFTWHKTNRYHNKNNGCLAGTKLWNDYIHIGFEGKVYQAHRLAFLYMTGSMPKYVDHINRVPSDNSWDNLRAATLSQNSKNSKHRSNNTSGYRCVGWVGKQNKWYAKMIHKGKLIYIGSFDCKHHAFCEYVIKSRELFGEFSPV